MVMENPFEGKEIWFGVGSQDLYGEEALRQELDNAGKLWMLAQKTRRAKALAWAIDNLVR